MDGVRGVQQRIINLPQEGLDLRQVQALLLEVADLLGSRPVRLVGPARGFVWRLQDRGVSVEVARAWGRDAYAPTFATFDWAELDQVEYRAFNVDTGFPAEKPYLWRIPLQSTEEPWLPAPAVARTWDEFFAVFQVLNSMPAVLAAIPEQWRPSAPRDALVSSSWNVDGPVVGSITVEVLPGRLRLFGYGAHDVDVEVTVADIERRGFSVPAFLAGLTESGNYAELQFFETSGVAVVFPTGPGEQGTGPEPDETVAGEEPERRLSLDDARALLAGPAQPERVVHQRAVEPLRFPLAATGVTALAYEMLTNPDQAQASAASAGLDVDAGTFRHGFREVPLETPTRPVPHRAMLWDPTPAWDYGTQVSSEVVRWLGQPRAVTGRAGAVTRLWRAGDKGGVQVRISGGGTTLAVGDYAALLATTLS